jgi:hypothetical protein
MVGQQIRVTVTILNAGHGYDPPKLVSLGSMIPSDTFDQGPKGCAFLDGGANCPVVGLRSGQKTSLVFAITPGWFPGGSGSDLIFGMLDGPNGQPVAPEYWEPVWVDDGTASLAPPTSGVPSGTPSPVGDGMASPPPATSAAPSIPEAAFS